MVSLLDSGADINAQDRQGQTALHIAALNREPWFVETLLSRGANALVKDDEGLSALGVVEARMEIPEAIEVRQRRLRICSMLSKAMWEQS